MAFKKTLPQRIFSAYKFSAPSLTTCRIASSTLVEAKSFSYDKITTTSDPRRFLHQSLASSPEIQRSLIPMGEKLREKLHEMDVITRDRMRLINGTLVPPPRPESVEDARKILRLTQLETLKSRIRKIEKSWILFAEFIEICKETCLDNDQGMEFAKKLDDSGDVIVLGNVVFLRPNQVVQAMQELMPMHNPNHDKERMKELEEMHEEKTSIDKKAELLVRKEMWFGLGCLVIQTSFHEVHFLGLNMGCYGTNLFLPHISIFHGYLFFLSQDIQRAFFSRLLPGTF